MKNKKQRTQTSDLRSVLIKGVISGLAGIFLSLATLYLAAGILESSNNYRDFVSVPGYIALTLGAIASAAVFSLLCKPAVFSHYLFSGGAFGIIMLIGALSINGVDALKLFIRIAAAVVINILFGICALKLKASSKKHKRRAR